MAEQMTRVALTRAGEPDVLVVERAPAPAPGTGEVVVSMEAAGVAFNDVTTRKGLNPGRLPRVLGFDVVGHVVSLGPGVTGLAVGQRVAALVGTGGYATRVIARADRAVAVPGDLDAAEVAALVLNYLTASQMLHRAARVQPGQSILVLGAAGGVGSALAELAALDGVRVYGTASAHRSAALVERGVTLVASQEDLPEQVDATFDPVGGPSLARSRRATREGGVVVSFGFSFLAAAGYSKIGGLVRTIGALLAAKATPGPRVTPFTIEAALRKDPAGVREDLARLVARVADGSIHPAVTTLPLARAADAHRDLEARRVIGKLVLVP